MEVVMELGPEVRKQQIGCRFESSRSAGRERASTAQAAASQSTSAGQASWSTGITRPLAAGRKDYRLYARTVHPLPVWKGQGADWLRDQRATGRRTGQTLRAGDQAGEARLPSLRRTGC